MDITWISVIAMMPRDDTYVIERRRVLFVLLVTVIQCLT